jgi:hypothetical protein
MPVGRPPVTPIELRSTLLLAANLHGEWVRIHPFANGNGRIARLWVMGVAARYSLPPFIRLEPRPAGPPYEGAAMASMFRPAHADGHRLGPNAGRLSPGPSRRSIGASSSEPPRAVARSRTVAAPPRAVELHKRRGVHIDEPRVDHSEFSGAVVAQLAERQRGGVRTGRVGCSEPASCCQHLLGGVRWGRRLSLVQRGVAHQHHVTQRAAALGMICSGRPGQISL